MLTHLLPTTPLPKPILRYFWQHHRQKYILLLEHHHHQHILHLRHHPYQYILRLRQHHYQYILRLKQHHQQHILRLQHRHYRQLLQLHQLYQQRWLLLPIRNYDLFYEMKYNFINKIIQKVFNFNCYFHLTYHENWRTTRRWKYNWPTKNCDSVISFNQHVLWHFLSQFLNSPFNVYIFLEPYHMVHVLFYFSLDYHEL